MSLHKLLIIFIAMVMGSGTTDSEAAEQDLDAGVAAVEQQDYMTAYQIFKALATAGNKEAQFNLAILYRQGKGVMQDSKLAAEWFQKSADQGLASAQYYMGLIHDFGEGVEKNPQLAAQWYQKGAEGGDPLAQANLGVSYANGEGVKQDVVLAYVWFSLAASQGLTTALENRNALKKDMSDEMVQNAQRLTREYFNRYVEPFQPPIAPRFGGNHPRIEGGHPNIRPELSAPGQLPPGHSDIHKQ